MYEKPKTIFCYFCNGLFLIGKDDFRRMTSIYKLFRRHKELEDKFQQLINHSYTKGTKLKGGQSYTQWKKTNVVCCPHRCSATISVCKIYINLCMLLSKNKYVRIRLIKLFSFHCRNQDSSIYTACKKKFGLIVFLV